MYIYETGLIGEAVRTKLENKKKEIMTGEEDVSSFGDVLRSLMNNTDSENKAVGMMNIESASAAARADGRNLIYALNNSTNDDTAAAVVNALGLSAGESTVKTAADSLTSAIDLLHKTGSSDSATVISGITDFVNRFNALLADLKVSGSVSGLMYANIMKTAASTASEELAEAGVSVKDDGSLEFSAEGFSGLSADQFLASVATAATAVSTYSSSISGSSGGVLDFLRSEDESDYSTSDYFNALINSYNV